MVSIIKVGAGNAQSTSLCEASLCVQNTRRTKEHSINTHETTLHSGTMRRRGSGASTTRREHTEAPSRIEFTHDTSLSRSLHHPPSPPSKQSHVRWWWWWRRRLVCFGYELLDHHLDVVFVESEQRHVIFRSRDILSLPPSYPPSLGVSLSLYIYIYIYIPSSP